MLKVNIISCEDEIKNAIVQAIVGLMHQEHGIKLTISVHQTAKVIGVSHLKIYELCRTDDFPCLKLGNRIVIPIIQLLEWIEKESWGSSIKGV